MKNISAQPNRTHSSRMLIARRVVKNFYKEVVHASSTSVNVTSSLNYQIEESIKDLMMELKDKGLDYELHLERDTRDNMRQWDLYLNGEHFATIDEDYGYDCFDISVTHFKETIATLIELSDIEPLTELERQVLDAQVKAMKMIKHSAFAQKINGIDQQKFELHKNIDSAFQKLKWL